MRIFLGGFSLLHDLWGEVRVERSHRIRPQAYAVNLAVFAFALDGLVVLGINLLHDSDHVLGGDLLGKPQLSQLFSHGRTSFALDLGQNG